MALPPLLLSSPRWARARVAAVAGACAAGVALAGCWFRFEDGVALRGILGTTSAAFAAGTLVAALRARTARAAAVRALGISTVLGFASTIPPSLLLSGGDPSRLPVLLLFGAFFGPIVGFAYGLVLAVLAAATFDLVAAGTHEATDRATLRAGLWAIAPLLVVLLAVFTERSERLLLVALLGLLLALAAALVALTTGDVQRLRRRRFLARVESEREPRWAIRASAPHDELARLPRLGSGNRVLEERLPGGAAYRTAAVGRAVAIV